MIPILDLFNIASSVIDRIFPDKTAAAAAQASLLQLKEQGALQQIVDEYTAAQGQIDTNKVEAANTSLFVAGWRPGCGWVCGAALAYSYIIQPFAVFTLALLGKNIVLPSLDISGLMPVLLGMLGLGAMRSYEKVNGQDVQNA